MRETSKANLVLQDGTVLEGISFGAKCACAGEVVFNTAMTAYPESLTDPSYLGQILVTTFPMLGNYGVPRRTLLPDGLSECLESNNIHPLAIVCQDYSWGYSHWEAASSLSSWLIEQGIAGISGIDTRALTKHLREHGSMTGKVIVEGCDDIPFYDPNDDNLVARASCKAVAHFGTDSGKRVVVVDCGVKHNIIRCLVARGAHVTLVPWDYDFTTMDYDGLFVSNGPGNPDFADVTVHHLRAALNREKPICGICMGNQLLAKAAGATTFKLKYGHRGHNQPVREVGTNRCFITSQNHGFAVDTSRLAADWKPLFVNMNDGTNEGIRHKTKPFFSTQFHPEACGGPTDTEFIFDRFLDLMTE